MLDALQIWKEDVCFCLKIVVLVMQIVKLPDSEKTAPGVTHNAMLCNCYSPLVIRLDGSTCGFVADKGQSSIENSEMENFQI
jgi:hypothetical protein